MQFGCNPGKGTVDAILIARRMQEKYQKKDESFICVLLAWKKAFGRVLEK